jgi:hypothetical protein
MLEEVTLETFIPHVGSSFAVQLDGEADPELRLVEATPLGLPSGGARTGAGFRAAFSLIFQGAVQPVLPQRIYPLVHPAIGRLEIFLVPIGPDRDGMRYQAIFT